MEFIHASLPFLECRYSPEMLARECEAHGPSVDNITEANPLGVVFLTFWKESPTLPRFQRHDSIHHQFSFSQGNPHATHPWVLVAIVTGVSVPFLWIFELLRSCVARVG